MESREQETVCIVGLGNHGDRYAATRHNAGYDAISRLTLLLDASGPVFHVNQYLFSCVREGRRLLLSTPRTYMNRSGEAVRVLREDFGTDPAGILVVCDDTNLPLGRLRIRQRGSAGGHNGLQSIIESLGTEAFPRIRCGIGTPPAGEDYADYVLSPFREEEKPAREEMIRRAAEAALSWFDEGVDRAMNRFNSGLPEQPENPGTGDTDDMQGTND